ncbi:MAG: DUF1801 domain-containing protein [Chitinophagaceae bacterium]|nr:DUF1801 domain-containing protein [Chitinophagaceae bacterium]
MQYKANSAEDYIAQIPEERQAAFSKLRAVIKKNLPKGFKEGVGYGMMGWSVPHSIYPAGYHCNPQDPLPFMGIASQKHFIAVYHMGVYANPKLLKWFQEAHAKASPKKLDMGKSCIRYKKPEDIPFDLIGELASKISVEDWIDMYETNLKDSRKKNK